MRKITAPLSVEQLYGGVPKRATVTTVMRIDGNEVYRSDALALPILTGKMELIVGLPASWDCGVGILTATVVTPGGVSESKTITLPLAVPKLQVRYPPQPFYSQVTNACCYQVATWQLNW